MVMFEPDLQLENQAYVFHDGQFELSANFYKPSSKRWCRATFIGPASAVDDYLAKSVEKDNISIGVPSTEDREKLIERGVSPRSVFYIPFLPNPAVTKVRNSKKAPAGAKVFINLNWGGPKDLSKLIELLPKQYNGQIHYRIWIGNENVEEIVKRHFVNNGYNLAEVAILCGGMPDEYLNLFIGETDLAICWNAEDEIGYFVRRLICGGIPVIGNLVGARRDIESGFVEVREISEIASSMVQVLDSWNQYHQAALDYRQRLSELPIFGDRLNSLKLIQEESRNKTTLKNLAPLCMS